MIIIFKEELKDEHFEYHRKIVIINLKLDNIFLIIAKSSSY